MQVTVQYMAQLRRLAGCGTEVIDFAGDTLAELFEALAERHGPAFRAALLEAAGGPQKSLLFFVGDEPADGSRPLREGACVTILAPMAGG